MWYERVFAIGDLVHFRLSFCRMRSHARTPALFLSQTIPLHIPSTFLVRPPHYSTDPCETIVYYLGARMSHETPSSSSVCAGLC